MSGAFYEECDFRALVGKTIRHIYMDGGDLVFDIGDEESIAYTVEGDCCSHSYFYDFLGIEHLLNNGPIIEQGTSGDVSLTGAGWDEEGYEDVKVYGYKLVTEHPEFGPVTSVMSFRNASNGYYGGWMRRCHPPTTLPPEVKADVLGTEDR